MSTTNQELYHLIKNELQYLKFKEPKNNHNNKKIYKKHKKNIDYYTQFLNKDSKVAEKLFCFLNNIKSKPKCSICESNVKFAGYTIGYHLFCSIACSQTISVKQAKINFIKKHGNLYKHDMNTYVDDLTPMKFICSIHGEFWQTPNRHKNGAGCILCRNEYYSKLHTMSKKQQLSEFENMNIGTEKYIFFWDTYKNTTTHMKMQCKDCNHIFFRTPNDHKQSKCGCPGCHESTGEKKVKNYLLKNNINYHFQHKFKYCKNKQQLPFDFYLTDHNICIEYDGEFHYIPFFSKKQLNYIKNNDKIKTEYCKNNNIQLIRIPYWEIDNIEKILEEFINLNN